MACSKGCSACCKIPVDLTYLEAEFIAFNLDKLRQNKDRVLNHNTDACPFLDEKETCSIYSFRPFNCRTYHVPNRPDLCATKDVTRLVFGSSESGFENVADFQFLDSLRHQLNGNMGYADIRKFTWEKGNFGFTGRGFPAAPPQSSPA
jgi:Fe-S-cluster containining protein